VKEKLGSARRSIVGRLGIHTTSDCFLSHNWGEDEQGRDNHARVKKVNDWLKDRFIETWFDEENFLPADPNIVRRMASGIDHAKCVVVFVTKRYIDKVHQEGRDAVVDNCQREFDYASNRKPDKLIAVVMEDACRSQRDWAGPVGVQLGRCMYIDARADVGTDEFEEAMEKLKTAIEQVTGQPAPLTARRVKTPEMRISSAMGRLVHGRV
jgi:hypothetical protein